jgi:hypothetical protein
MQYSFLRSQHSTTKEITFLHGAHRHITIFWARLIQSMPFHVSPQYYYNNGECRPVARQRQWK